MSGYGVPAFGIRSTSPTVKLSGLICGLSAIIAAGVVPKRVASAFKISPRCTVYSIIGVSVGPSTGGKSVGATLGAAVGASVGCGVAVGLAVCGVAVLAGVGVIALVAVGLAASAGGCHEICIAWSGDELSPPIRLPLAPAARSAAPATMSVYFTRRLLTTYSSVIIAGSRGKRCQVSRRLPRS